MKKLIALVMAVILLAATPTTVLADGTTTLTTTVPAEVQYTLNIPADQTVEYGTLEVDLGAITVTDSQGFAEGKNLSVTIDYTAFTAEGVDTTIPVQLVKGNKVNINFSRPKVASGSNIIFEGQKNGTVLQYPKYIPENVGKYYDADIWLISISSTDWGKALPGDYTSTITFTSEVVVDN